MKKSTIFLKDLFGIYENKTQFKKDVKFYFDENYVFENNEDINNAIADIDSFRLILKRNHVFNRFGYYLDCVYRRLNPNLKSSNFLRKDVINKWPELRALLKSKLAENFINKESKSDRNNETIINNYYQINQNLFIKYEVNEIFIYKTEINNNFNYDLKYTHNSNSYKNEINNSITKIFYNKTEINNNYNYDLKYTYKSNSYKNEIDNSIKVKYRYFYDKANQNSFINENDFLIIEEVINEISKEFTVSKDVLEYKGKKSSLIHKLIRFILFDEIPNGNNRDRLIIPRGMQEYEGLILLYLWTKSRKIKECDKEVFFNFYQYFIDFSDRSEKIDSQIKNRNSSINHFNFLKDLIINGDIQAIIDKIKESQIHKMLSKKKRKKTN
jgi:hypothetical protein